MNDTAAGCVPAVGGPLDGDELRYSANGLYCLSLIGPASIRHHWYVMKSWGRMRDGKPEYRDRYVYLGLGTMHGPECRK